MDKWLNRVTDNKSTSENCPVSSASKLESASQDVNYPMKIRKCLRKYDPDYINIGFTVIDVSNEPRTQCVICFEILSNQCMKPSLLKRHLSTKHSTLENKPKDYFVRKLSEMKSTKKIISSFSGSTEKAVEASFLVSLRIAKCGKPHTIGEELILPAAKDMVTCMLGVPSAKQLDMISLSNDTVRRRIENVSNYAQLMVYVRYVFQTVIKEDFLFCEALSTRTTADEIFKKLNHFFVENGLNWKKCVGFCSDGARAMTGKHGGVASKIKLVTENCTFIHCSIHREALVVKRMPEQFKLVLQEAIKVVNFIKSRALQSRLFTKLCSEMGSDHIQLLLHTEVRWLSRGRMLSRLFELHSEVQLFLGETNFELKDKLTDNLWITTLAYLSDIFNRLNVLNLSLQEHELQVEADLVKNIRHHCKMLKTTFEEYFKEDYSEFFWIRNPFILDLDDIPKTLTNNEKESLIELSCDESLKMEFTKLELDKSDLNIMITDELMTQENWRNKADQPYQN
ncbi:zinc finger BED domain-containing protein 5-like [Sipha flava]|uniref:Zinc finger BED domain-containing protein 5-like n=1 Tax=Sipha flava TaxID=143950 RepID=A0A8B8GM38_9HEMI|nr:zinc finger BED domain-containing protein 5-like [Sipha flava]